MRVISLPVTCALFSDVMSCSSIDIIDGGKDVRLPVKTGYAEVLNLTHETLETLQLEKTDWETVAVGPHTGDSVTTRLPGITMPSCS